MEAKQHPVLFKDYAQASHRNLSLGSTMENPLKSSLGARL